MVQVTQTEEEVKIVIEINRLMVRKPDVVILPFYLKFNNPPIFFERHLTNEIDEMASFCRIFKNEARIVLVKKVKGIWPEIFVKLNKDELLKKRLEIADLIVARNKERDKEALERFETKRRAEIEKEVKRETEMRERVKQFQENSCRETLKIDVRKDNPNRVNTELNCNLKNSNLQSPVNTNNNIGTNANRLNTPPTRHTMAAIRSGGRINVCFSSAHKLNIPKRESQGVLPDFTKMEGKKQE